MATRTPRASTTTSAKTERASPRTRAKATKATTKKASKITKSSKVTKASEVTRARKSTKAAKVTKSTKVAKATKVTKSTKAERATKVTKATTTRASAKVKVEGPGAFTGFPKGGGRFFHELALEQSRDWFHAHKHEYEALWQRPMQALLETLHARLSRVYGPTPLAAPKLFRIQRDVRFAKDKSPYKTNIAGLIPIATSSASSPTEAPAALYLHLGLEQLAAAGAYVLDGPALARYRAAVAEARTGDRLVEIVESLESAGLTLSAHATLARVPRGFDADHPRARLLRQKGLIALFPKLTPATVASPELVEVLVKQATRVRPLLEWLLAHALG
jgi:uncharacterized protein (TIGR02453 family)